MSTQTEGTVFVYDPTAPAAEKQDGLATRFNSLDGKVIGFLNNTKDHTDIIFEQVADMISERYPQVELRFFRKESVSGMLPEMMADMEKECDAVVTGLGD
ncbi:MAG: hypothetical protein CMM76_11710 [Rhodospirillaceae bacterium]|nr:hypothetical protein [Rhodospirillaceae bacterium]|tara:strand:- start:407 stop:706 length:300 start_codon:yes stop_codon:yes gene_type:complete